MHTDFLSPGRDRRPPQFPQVITSLVPIFLQTNLKRREKVHRAYFGYPSSIDEIA